MGPAQLSADSAKDSAKRDSKRPLKRPPSTPSRTSHSSPPRRSKTSDTTSASTATANQLSAEKTPLMNKAAINKVEKAPLSDGKPPLSNLEQSGGKASESRQSSAGNSRRGARGRRGGKGRARQSGARTKDGLWVPRAQNSHAHRARAPNQRWTQWQGQPAVPPSTRYVQLRQRACKAARFAQAPACFP